MNSTIVYYDAVKNLLEKGGYRTGFQVLSVDVVSQYVCSYWYADRNIVLIKHSAGIINSIKFCNSGDSIKTFGNSIKAVKEALLEGLKNPCDQPPSILGTFDNILFKSYDSNTDKYNSLMQAVNSFQPEFLMLFQDEINQMTSAETSVTTAVRRYQWFHSESGYCYVTDIIGNTVLVDRIATANLGIDRQKKLDLRELQNNYTMAETPEDLNRLLQMVLCGFHEVFNVRELVPILQAVGCTNLEELSKIANPVVFSGEDQINCVSDDGIVVDKRLVFSSGDFQVYCSFDTTIFFQLSSGRSYDTDTFVQSACELVGPCNFYECVVELVSKVLKTFNMILWNQQYLHSYLYQLLGALESVVPSEDIPYEATWDDYPVSGYAVTDTTNGRSMISEMQPSKMQF